MPIAARRVAPLNLGQSRLLRRLFPLAFLLAAVTGNAVASTFTVTTTSDAVSLMGSLRYAIANASPGDAIAFSVTGTITLTQGALAISQNLTITGPGGGLAIDGNSASQIFNISGGTVSISGLTLQNGQNPILPGGGSAAGGGAIYNNGALTITSCTFSGNSDPTNGLGGAIFNDSGGTLTISNSTFSGNTAPVTMYGGGEGGAIYDQGTSLSGTLSITNSTFSNNQVTDPDGTQPGAIGGAIYTNGNASITGSTFSGNTQAGISFYDYGGAIAVDFLGTLTLSNSTISGNQSNGSGAGGLVNLGITTINASTFSGNSAPGTSSTGGDGGAILNLSGLSSTMTIVDSTISGNSVADSGNAGGAGGGAIFNVGGTVTVQNSTISGNSQTGTGNFNLVGGIVNVPGAGGTVTLTNTILAGNTDSGAGFPDGYGPFDPTSAANLIGNGRGMSGISNGSNRNQVGTSLSPINPGLNPLGNYGGPTQTMWPLPGSPAIAAGSTASTTVVTDQRGLPRTVNGNVDIGAVEFQGVTLSSSSGSGQTAAAGTAFTNPLTATWVETGSLLPLAGVVVNYTAPSSGASATLHTSPTTTASNGASSISATANTIAGSYTVTASLNGVTANFSLTNLPGSATLLSVSGPGATTAGTAFSVTVTARDQYGNVATGYRGIVSFASTDPSASVVLPANYTFISGDNGVHTFTNAVKLITAGSQTVTATDTVSSSIKGTTGIVVSAGVTAQLSVSAPVSATAGTGFSVTVTAQDQYGNTTQNYTGTVRFTSTDTNALVVLPANYTFTAGGDFGGDFGVHTFTGAVKLITSGNQTVTATDTVSGSIKGTSNGIAVSAGAATLLSVSAPGSATAGTAFSVTVTALDQYNNTAAGYRGTVNFTSTDTNTSVVLPANYAFVSGDNGVHTFTSGVKLVTFGNQTVTATDTLSSSIKGTSNGIAVNAGAATLLSVSAPGSATAGTAFSVTVTALDQFNNTATSYRGTVKFTSTDTNASVVLPANYAFTSGDNGVHVFTNGATLVTAGSQTVTATDTVTSSIKGTSSGITVGAGAPHLSVSAPGSATAGTAFSVTVTALDQFNNTATSYRGTVSFTSTDTNTSVVLPANYAFTSGDNGAHTFTNSVTLVTSGSQTVTATGTVTSSDKGTSGGITVSAAAATLLSVSAPASATAGTAFSVTVTALDQFNNTATGYRGTVKFTSTDTNASVVLPANYAFTSGDNGVHVFTNGVTLATVGSQTVTATDTVSSSIKGTSSGITVGAGTPHLSVSAPASTAAGTAFSVTVTAQDQFNNTATGYRGTVSFTSTDTNTSVVLPANYTFTAGDNGVHTFANGVKLVTSGSQTVTATDTVTGSIKGTSNGIAVTAGAATMLSVSAPGSATTGIAFSVTVTALDQYSNAAPSYRGTVKFTSTDASTFVILPANYTFTSGDNGVHTFANGVTLVTVGSQTVTATDTSSSSIKGTSSGITVNPPGYTVQVISVANGLTGTQMYGINDSGQVAEWGTQAGSTLPLTFIATPSGSVPIPLPSNSGANGYAINKWGEIAGILYPSMQGYIGFASGITLIPLPAGSSSVNANAVNDSRQIAGWVPSSGLSYIGSAAGSATIPLPGGWTSASAYAINNPGEIAGSLTNGSTSAPFIGTPGNITVVPVTAYWMNPRGNLTAYAINDSGQIAGFGINSNGAAQAFVGTADGIAAIPLPAGATQAMVNTQCLNNNGSVVGQSNLGGWIWDAINGTRLLNGMVPSGWSITNAISISNGGLILAQGSFNGGVSQYVELIPSGYMTVSYTELNFGLGGGVSTDPQSVTISFEGKPLSWTVSSNQSNVTVSPASGAGMGAFQVTAGAGPSATVTVTAPGAVNSLQSIAVNVASVTPAAPFGSFDSPSTTGNPTFSGEVAVSGWALDTIEVTGVDIWREPVTGETGSGLRFLGNAAFLAGARPDVQAAFPTTPLNYRGGWGYLMLSNGLPNSSGSGPIGNGTFKIHAIAHNKAGAQTDLGTKTITVDNADSTLPFGTLDTPLLGQTVSGLVTNFGWAVTPSMVGCPAADQPCIIPTDGSTIVVYVDGIPYAHPVYNLNRCDISQSFPNPPYLNSGSTNCATNGTSPGPVGYYYLDTTMLSNGVHTITWSVTDNAGRAVGIGARYFTVAN